MTVEIAGRRRHLARNTLFVAASFGMAAAAGLVRNMVIARRFGIGADLDAYYAAFKLPDLLFTIVAGGALATAFIPVLADYLSADDRQGAWRLASAITNLVVLIVSGLALLAGILAPWLVRVVIAPGFEPALQVQTANIMRLVLVSTVIFGISAVQASVLHGFKHFILPALAPVAYPLGVIGGALFLAPAWGIYGLAAGAVIGAALHLAVKIPALVHYGFRWWPVLDIRTAAVRRVAILMGPRVLDLGVFHLTLLVTTNLASRLGAGRVSALEWGWQAMQLPETIIGTAIGLVAFPTLAELAARRDFAGLRGTLSDTLRAVLTFAIPAAAGLILLGRPMLQTLYQRGAFDAAATEVVFTALRFYALGLVGHASLEIAARAFFAQQDTITPLLLAAGSAALNIVLGLVLMGPLGHGGLALANSVAISVEVLALLFILRRRLGGLDGRRILSAIGRIAAATALMALAVLGVLALGRSLELRALWLLLLGAGAGGLTYLAAGLLFGVEALRWPLNALRRLR